MIHDRGPFSQKPLAASASHSSHAAPRVAPACRLAQQSDAGASLPGFFVRLKDSPLQQPQQQPLEERPAPLPLPLEERPAPLPLRLSRILQAKAPLMGTGRAVIVLLVDRGDGSETIARVRQGQWGRKDIVFPSMLAPFLVGLA